MPRTLLTKTAMLVPYPTLQPGATTLDMNLQAADVSNKNSFAPSGDDLLIVQNSGGVTYTFTLTSAPDPYNRTGDIATYSLGANVVSLFRVKTMGWVQSDGRVYLEANNALVKFAVVAQ